jgi:hypothetical protein
MTDDLAPDLNTTEGRNRLLDAEILKSGEEVAGLTLRPITAGDLALLIEAGVGLVIGRTDSIAFDVGAILFSQSKPKNEIRKLASKRNDFRAAVYDFLDSYEPDVFAEATPRIVELVDRMNSAKTAVRGEVSGATGENHDPKAGGQVG